MAHMENKIMDRLLSVDERGSMRDSKKQEKDIADIMNTIELKEGERVDGKPYFSTDEGYKWLGDMVDMLSWIAPSIKSTQMGYKLLQQYSPDSKEKLGEPKVLPDREMRTPRRFNPETGREVKKEMPKRSIKEGY